MQYSCPLGVGSPKHAQSAQSLHSVYVLLHNGPIVTALLSFSLVCPMQVAGQSVHGAWYATPVLSLSGLTSSCFRVTFGWKVNIMPKWVSVLITATKTHCT